MSGNECIVVNQSLGLQGTATLSGAKNATLVIIASLILTRGKSTLHNVPNSGDVHQMIKLLQDLGAQVQADWVANSLEVDTTSIDRYTVSPEIMNTMRASVLVMGPLLARFGKAKIALPGGCGIGARPIDYHLKNFAKMGVSCDIEGSILHASVHSLIARRLVLDYPSVGATENIMMAATLTPGVTHIVNAALEPEVLDLIDILKKMGADIVVIAPSTIQITGVAQLHPVQYTIMHDRLEAGALLLAAAITGGHINLPQARADLLDVFLLKLVEMGHTVHTGPDNIGISLIATDRPQAVSFVTGPYPQFPTDLQAPMMVALCLADGQSEVHETVFENRLMHVSQLQKMGALIDAKADKAVITGVRSLQGCAVNATDIRASCALVLAGLVAGGQTVVHGIHHWRRGYDAFENKLSTLGAAIKVGQN